MNLGANIGWHEANQRYLMARLAVVRDALARHATPTEDSEKRSSVSEIQSDFCEAAEDMPAPAALDTLCAAFSLSSFERDVLLLCAGVELDSAFASLCAKQNPTGRGVPTFSLALAVLPDPHWSAITPAGPLRHWRLIEVGVGEALTTSPLRVDERILHYLAGVSYLDDRLQALLELQRPPQELPSSHRVLAERVVDLWAPSEPKTLPIIHLGGDEPAAKRTLAAFACAKLGLQLFVLDTANVPTTAVEREALARLWEREAVLSRSSLFLDCNDSEKQHSVSSFLQQLGGCLFVASRVPLNSNTRPMVRVEVGKLGAPEQVSLWHQALGTMGSQLNGELERLVSQFDLGAEEIGTASSQILAAMGDEPEADASQFWNICRINARGRMDDLAQRIEPVADWADLVLPAAQLQVLHEIATHVRQRARVYGTWGFASKGVRGLGISALFAGASGTGKTMAAEVLANDLRLDLYRIDLSQVVSKYIGETEKNLRRVFDAAEAGGAILLFDEADALFGKRSEVKDSHDRYANIEISYLLQRMECYRGLAILTTNMKNTLDAAFMRRLRFSVQFPFPDAAQRAQIWQRVFPLQTPVEGLDVGKLARLNVAGGNIRNIAMQAAFLAAESDEPVRMGHLLRAARGEYAKLEKPLTGTEIAGW